MSSRYDILCGRCGDDSVLNDVDETKYFYGIDTFGENASIAICHKLKKDIIFDYFKEVRFGDNLTDIVVNLNKKYPVTFGIILDAFMGHANYLELLEGGSWLSRLFDSSPIFYKI
jgi:hypothetical protein